MNDIISFLELENSDILVDNISTNISTEGQVKTITPLYY